MIHYFGNSHLNNFYSGVDGSSQIRLPFIKELHERDYKINFTGFINKQEFDNQWLKVFGLEKDDYFVTVEDIVTQCPITNKTKINSDDTLFVELRPHFKKKGYSFEKEYDYQNFLIKKFIKVGAKIFIADQDGWFQGIKHEFRKDITLLRAYSHEIKSFPHQEEFVWGWSKAPFQLPCKLNTEKMFGACYVGNEHRRRNEFYNFLKEIQSKTTILVTGNWFRKKTRNFLLDKLPYLLCIGTTSHWSTLPLLNMSSCTFHVSHATQRKLGIPCIRIFEAYMAGIPCYSWDKIKGIEKYVPNECLFSNPKELEHLILKGDHYDNYKKFGKQIKLYSNKHLVDKFEKLMNYG